MMIDIQYLLGISGALLTLFIVIEMLRRRRLRERHAFWWLLAGFLALLISIFPSSLDSVAAFLGFEVPVNLVFFASLFVLFLVALQHSSELTTLESHNRRVAEELVLLKLKLEQLEKNNRFD
jgi:hypothetical protein